MKCKALIIFLSIVISINIFFIASAEDDGVYNSIIEYNLQKYGSSDIQEWIDNGLSNDIGVSAEWYVLALSHSGSYNFSEYEKGLLNYLETKRVSSASTREKFALALSAIGSNSEYITEALNNSLGEQGIMSYIYGLHLQNNGYIHNSVSASETVEKILSLELTEGGWCLRGSVADVDVTAMAIQALAPFYDDEDVKLSVDKALAKLSALQLEGGDYLSYGVANPESPAQVLVALSSLGIDGLSDQRFIKNGNTLLDGIMKYQLENGSFCHNAGGLSNSNSTVQVFFSLVSYNLFKENKEAIYNFKYISDSDESSLEASDETSEDFSKYNSEENSINSSEYNEENSKQSTIFVDSEEPSSYESSGLESVSDNQNNSYISAVSQIDNATSETSIGNENKTVIPTYKKIIIAVIILLSIVLSMVLFILKKRNYKNYLSVLIIAVIFIFAVFAIDIQSEEEYYNGDFSKENPIGKVYMSINCSVVANQSDNKFIPDDGVILPETEFEFEAGDTVYDILIDASKKYSIQIENNGSAEMAYIAGINYIYEFDYGDLSGWMFQVNGVDSSVGCSDYVLNDGDIICWKYTLETGKDFQ